MIAIKINVDNPNQKVGLDDDHIPGTNVAISLLRLRLAYSYEIHKNTALHASKDLAVSPARYRAIIPNKRNLFPFGFSVTARTS